MKINKLYPGGGGGLNADDIDIRLMETEYPNLHDFRWGSTDKGATGVLECVGGTVLIANAKKPAGNNICIGGAVERANRRAVLCYWNDLGNHSIFCFDYVNNRIDPMLLNNQVVGGLNFDKYHLIDGRVENGAFYWTDNFNEPRRINIQYALEMNFDPANPLPGYSAGFVRADGVSTNPYSSPISQAVLKWIRRQPGLPLSQVKVLESPVPAVNFLGKEAFQFAYRYQCKTKEYTTLSAWSTTADFNQENTTPTITPIPFDSVPVITRGYLATSYELPSSPSPAYGPGVLAKLTRQGTGGSNAADTDIPIPLDWTGYPATRSYTRVIVEGLNNYFKARPGSDNPGNLSAGDFPQTTGSTNYLWYISYRDGVHPTLNIKETWDWGLGDSSFPPTTLASLTLYTETPPVSQEFNRIDLAVPLGETIDQDIIQIDVVARFLTSNFYGIIQSWKTSNPADAAAIAAHNAGTTPLSFRFYNNVAPVAIDPTYAVKPFDSVPNLVKAIELAKNRGFMGNYTSGYDSQNLSTSLAISQTIQTIGGPPGSVITGEWFLLTFFNTAIPTQFFSQYVIRTTTSLTPQPPSAFYYYTIAGAAPPFPANITTGIQYLGPDLNTVMTTIINQHGATGSGRSPNLVDQNASSALQAETVLPTYGVRAKVFKQSAPYMASIHFLDNEGRKGGIITNNTLLINIPNTGFSENQWVTTLNWTLSNTHALAEIPVEAHYYSINLTKCLRTRFFVEAIGFAVYANKTVAGEYTFTDYVYSTDLAGIAIDLTLLNSNGMGYSFTDGDIMNFFWGSTNYTSAVIGQSGKYVIVQLQDIGNLSTASTVLFELYTPYKPAAGQSEPHYEIGQLFPILNPGTIQRQYSVTQGAIGGDVYLFQRSNFSIPYFAEAMSPNDKLYKFWFTDAGRPNEVDYIGKVTRATSIVFSNTFIDGSADNGLSTFDALDNSDLSPDFGPIQKLKLASKVSKIGTVMLAICSGPQTASIYLGENTLISAEGASTVGQSNSVIGSVHQLKGDYGTLNPESVIEYKGNIYWWDIQSGKVIQYADDGLFAISNYKLTRFAKLFSDQFKSMTPQQIEAFGGRPFIFGAVDPHHEELLFVTPQTLAAPPKGYVPDYPNNFLPVTNIDPTGGAPGFGGLNVCTFALPTSPSPPYGSPALTCYLVKTNTDGSTTLIEIPLNWSSYPGENAGQIITNGFVSLVAGWGGRVGIDFNVASAALSFSVYFSSTWTWGDGKAATSLQLMINPPVNQDGSVTDIAIPWPWDFWDGQGKIVVYAVKANPNKWIGAYRLQPEYLFDLEDNLFLVKEGDLYLGNQSNYCNYFGVQYQPEFMGIMNKDIDYPKPWKNLSVQATAAPLLAYLMTVLPFEQSTDLIPSDFQNVEGVWVAKLYKNKLDPRFDGNFQKALISGEDIRGNVLYVMARFDATQGIVQIKFINAGYTLSEGVHLGTLQ